MRAFPRFLFGAAGSFLFLTAPLLVPDAGAQGATDAAAPPARTTVSWTTFKGDDQRTGSSKADVKLPLSLNWRYSSDGPARTYDTSPLVIGAPGRQRVIFGAGRNVFCLDSQTGAQVWRSPNLTSNVITPLTLLSGPDGDLIITAQQSGRVAALRASDGGRAWETDTLASITDAGPVLINTPNGQRIICAVSAGRLVALNLDGTLDPNWTLPLGRYGISPTTAMAVSQDGSLIYICGSDAKLYAIDVQKPSLAYSIQLAANSTVTPVVAGDQVITCNVRRIAAFTASGGASAWTFDPRGEVIGSPSIGTDATGKNIVYFGTRNGLFYALDNTGALVWKTDVGSGILGSPLVLPSIVIVGTSNGLLLGFDPSNGSVIWQYRLKSDRPVATQTTTGGFGGRRGGRRGGGGGFGTAGGTSTGVRTWGVSSAPTAVDGQLFVLGDNAALYSFTTQILDAAPPRVIEPSLAVPDDQNKITPLLLSPTSPPVVPGRGPIYFAAQMDDTGSGVNPATIKVTVDDVAVPNDAIDFQTATGILTVTLLDPKKGGVTFPDGLKNLNLTANDYAGNLLQYAVAFSIDNTVPAPSSQQSRFGRFGGGNFGNGGDPNAPDNGGGDNNGGDGNVDNGAPQDNFGNQ